MKPPFGARFSFRQPPLRFVVASAAIALWAASAAPATGTATFPDHTDVGAPARPGAARVLDAVAGDFEISGGGSNMWFASDSFHFIWTRVAGDFRLESTVEWLGTGGDPHRKACLVVRQDLDPDSVYADIAVHGDGLTSLQYRETKGGPTREIRVAPRAPGRVGIARQGAVVYATAGGPGETPRPAGAFMRIAFRDPVYVGLGVCAHDDHALETARFKGVSLVTVTASGTNRVLHAALETITIASRDRKVAYHTTNHIEAPNWSRDGASLIFNGGGRIHALPLSGGDPRPIDTGFAIRCNNDHGLSPDGSQLAISDQSQTGKSLIYIVPSSGGTPRQVTTLGPSYWHGWSPDGGTLVYCAERNGEFDVYSIPAEGGDETRLTTAAGLDDGPEYSPDGQWIYFNSDRTGRMQIWRMRPDGSGPEQVTSDDLNNWFAHPSPDGRWIVFLSYEADVKGHPANQPVRLRLMPAGGGPAQELARLFGGQGTINVPSWSPDSRQLAFVSYEWLDPGAAPESTLRLPKPRTEGGRPLMEALRQRRTQREISPARLPDQVLSDLLWAGFGINRPEDGRRTAPSAMNSQEIDLYVARPDGLFLYDAGAHNLRRLGDRDLRSRVSRQPFATNAPVILIYVADLPRLAKARPDTRPFYAGFDAGCISQNVYLYCASEGLATVVFDLERQPLAEAMGLREGQQIVLAQAVGKPAGPAPAGR